MSITALVTRRDLLSVGGAAALAGAAPDLIVPRSAKAQNKRLKILQWKHFVPAYDEWFNGIYVKQWGQKNEVEVIVDNVGLSDLGAHAQSEIAGRAGHDLVQFLTPTATYEDYVIDHRDIYQECAKRYGSGTDLSLKSTYNPKTDKYFAFCHAYQPTLITYRKDLWDSVRASPSSWTEVLTGGRRVKLLHEKPVGVSLAPEFNGEYTWRAVLYSFGASEQDETGRPALKSAATLDAIRYVKSLYEQAMTADVLAWDAPSNNRYMLNGEGCLTLDTVSIVRASEHLNLPFAPNLRLAKVPDGPVARVAPPFGLSSYMIWNFAENIATAKQFIVDFVGQSRESFVASGFQNMPTWSETVPDLPALLAADQAGGPTRKYEVLGQAAEWSMNVGFPGHTNAAISEVLDRGILSQMFARAATGRYSPEQALDQADRELRVVFQRWRDSGKL